MAEASSAAAVLEVWLRNALAQSLSLMPLLLTSSESDLSTVKPRCSGSKTHPEADSVGHRPWAFPQLALILHLGSYW